MRGRNAEPSITLGQESCPSRQRGGKGVEQMNTEKYVGKGEERNCGVQCLVASISFG